MQEDIYPLFLTLLKKKISDKWYPVIENTSCDKNTLPVSRNALKNSHNLT